jgi:outer membrane lipoprotein-sorting protein
MGLCYSALALSICLLATVASAQAGTSTADVTVIVQRMLAAQDENRKHLRTFTVKRDYQLLDKRLESKAQVIAEITYLSPGQKQYRIESSSGGMGEKILRDVLAHETAPGDMRRRELSLENYNFQLVGERSVGGHLCYLLAVTPKREEKDLIRGQIWVDEQSYKIHRIEGKPAKNPSWLIRDLFILMTFADVSGMWLQTSIQAVANVRFKGQYTMVTRDLEYFSAEHATSKLRGNSGILVGVPRQP